VGALKKICLAFALLVIVYFLCVTFSALNNHYSWKSMDWNEDGTTSIFEFFHSSDVGKREIKIDNKVCTEYFSYKDGLPIKQVCENEP